jgi:PAS domain S-box-containing protein
MRADRIAANDRYWDAALATQASVPMYVLDSSGNLIRMNAHGLGFTGRSLEQLQGSGWQTCIHPDDLDVLCKLRLQAISRQTPYTATYRMGSADGGWRWVHDQGSPVKCESEFLWFGILDDVHDIVTAQRRMQEANHGLERSNRDLHHFASIVAHDLQSPLGTVATMSAWLVEEYRDRLDAQAQEYLAYMGKAVQRMNALVTAALRYSSANGDSRALTEQIDSGDVLAWTLITLSEEIKQRRAVVTSDRLPKVSCSEHALVQLFQNLVSNALRYSVPGSFPRVHVSAIRTANGWTFSVADSGIGIDPTDTARIFELFQRVNRDKDGMGIGLSICRKVVESIGGSIWVESEPGKGSTFRFTLPDSGTASASGSRT